MKRFLHSYVMLQVCVLTSQVFAAQPVVLDPNYLNKLITESTSKHPKVEAAAARSQAAMEAIHGVRLWQDPELGLGVTAARRSMRQDDGDIKVAFDQMLPRRNLYDAEKRRATAEQRMQNAERYVTANELGLTVAQTAIELALADDTLSFQEQEIHWLETSVKTAQERSKNPDATSVEPLRLESELAVRSQKWESGKRQRAQMAETLNIMLLRDPKSSWPTLTLSDQANRPLSSTNLRAELEKNNPRLLALRHQIEAAQAETDAAKEKGKPVFSVGVESNIYSGGDFRDAMFLIKMSLPWFNRSAYKADVAQAANLKRAAEGDRSAEAREFQAQLNMLITEVENNSRLSAAYQSEVLPKSLMAVESMENAWISSKATLSEVLDSRRALLDARQEQKRAAAAQQAALQSLSAITGNLVKIKEEQP
ncbi:hypothetical protein BH11VER1_BH11VER1_01020 [soil metagenome]